MSHAWPSLPLAIQPRGVDAPMNSSSMRMGCWIPVSALEFVLRRTHKAPHAQTPPLDPRRCQNPPHARGTQDRQSHRPNLKTHGSRCALQSTHQANQTRDEVDTSIAHQLDAIQHRLRFSTPTNTMGVCSARPNAPLAADQTPHRHQAGRAWSWEDPQRDNLPIAVRTGFIPCSQIRATTTPSADVMVSTG